LLVAKGEEDTIPQNKKIISVICAMLVNLMIGSYYAYSNINPYVAAYLKSFNPSITSKDTLLILPIWLVNQSIFSIIGVRLSEKLGYVKVNLIAYVGYTLVTFIMIFVTQYWQFIIVYGFLTGITIGLGYLPSMYIAWTYFPQSKSMITGVILFTAGISASILSPITTWIVNPDNLPDYSTNPLVYNNVPRMYTFLFLYFGVLTLVACILQPQPYLSKEYKEGKDLTTNSAKNSFYRKFSMVRQNSEVPSQGAPEDRIDAKSRSKGSSGRLPSGELNEKVELPNVAELGSGPLKEKARQSIKDAALKELDADTKRVYHLDQLKQDFRGVMDPQTAMLLGHMETDKVIDLVRHKSKTENAEIDIAQEKQVNLKRGMSMEDAEAEFELMMARAIHKTKQDIYRKSIKLRSTECPSVRMGLKSLVYLRIALMAFGCSIVNYFLNSVWKDFYKSKFYVSDDKMALLLSLGGVSNSLARLAAGALLLRVSFKKIYLGLVCTALFTSFTANIFINSYWAGAMYIMFVFAGIGTQVTIFPTVTTSVFGPAVGPKVYPFVYLIFSVSNITQYLTLKLCTNWTAMFYVFGSCALMGLAVGLTFDEKPDWIDANIMVAVEEEEKREEVELKLLEDGRKEKKAGYDLVGS